MEFSVDLFESEVLNSDLPVMVDFWSDGCPPCKQLAPLIEELAVENEGVAKVGKVNVGENMDLAIEYAISAVPTIIVFKDGEVVERIQGFRNKEELQSVISKHV